MKAGAADPTKLAQAVRVLVASIPWGHHTNLLHKITDPAARLYYLRATAQFGWSRNVLLNQIKAGAYERAKKEKKTHNFELALPEHFAEQAGEKSLAVFENYSIRRIYDEESETWYFSVVDIIQALIQQPDYQTARKYWNKLKERLKKEGSQR